MTQKQRTKSNKYWHCLICFLLLFCMPGMFLIFSSASFGKDILYDFTLGNLSKENRILNIEELIVPKQFKVTHFSEGLNENKCKVILKNLQTSFKEETLEPTNVYWGKSDVAIVEEFRECPSFSEVNLDYYPSKDEWEDFPVGYVQRSNFLEVYDLSNLFVSADYAFLSEGGRPECPAVENELCKNMIGFETRLKIVDTKKCELKYNIPLLSSRLKMGVISGKDTLPFIFRTNDFTSFLANDDSLFIISYRTNQLSAESCKIIEGDICKHKERTDLNIIQVFENDDISAQYCKYEMPPIKKGL